MLDWDDRTVATAWELLRETKERQENEGKERAGKRSPGAGGPQYSG